MRRPAFEIGLLAVGVALGVGFVLLGRSGPPPSGDVAIEAPAVEIAWRHRTGGPIVSGPTMIDGRVYVGSHDNRIHCVDAATGRPVWEFETGDDVAAPPLVVGGRVYVGSADGTLYAVDAVSGARLWTYATGDRILGGAALFRADDGAESVLVGSYDRRLHCVDASTGVGRWTVETTNYVNGAPAISGDAVVFGGCDGLVHVVGAVSGEFRRDVSLGEGVHIASSVVVEGGVAYVAHVDNGCAAVAVESGEVLWTYAAANSYFASPAIAADRVIVGGRDRHLRALDRATGKPRWAFAVRDDLDATPTVADGTVFVGSSDGRLYAVDLGSGRPIWEYAFGGAITAAVAVAGDMLFVGCEDGTLYALRARR